MGASLRRRRRFVAQKDPTGQRVPSPAARAHVEAAVSADVAGLSQASADQVGVR